MGRWLVFHIDEQDRDRSVFPESEHPRAVTLEELIPVWRQADDWLAVHER